MNLVQLQHSMATAPVGLQHAVSCLPLSTKKYHSICLNVQNKCTNNTMSCSGEKGCLHALCQWGAPYLWPMHVCSI